MEKREWVKRLMGLGPEWRRRAGSNGYKTFRGVRPYPGWSVQSMGWRRHGHRGLVTGWLHNVSVLEVGVPLRVALGPSQEGARRGSWPWVPEASSGSGLRHTIRI